MLHIALSKPLDFKQIGADASAGRGPIHVLLELCQSIPSRFHMPTPDQLAPNLADRMRSRIFSTPELWSLAYQILGAANADDTIFATGEDIGIPLATLARDFSYSPRIVLFAHNLSRPRARLALRMFRCRDAVRLWLTNAGPQQEFLATHLGVPQHKIFRIPEQTDTAFFVPGPPSADPEREKQPFLFSAGLEMRDYHTLALVTRDLAVPLEISAYSQDARLLSRALPSPLPSNWSRATHRHTWQEFRALYRSADIVIIPLHDNPFCAGLTAVLEALACQKPVVITHTQGLASYLPSPTSPHAAWLTAPLPCCPVPPGDPPAMRSAIEFLRSRPEFAQQLAAAGRNAVLARHTPREWLSAMSALLAPAGISFNDQIVRAIAGHRAAPRITSARAS